MKKYLLRISAALVAIVALTACGNDWDGPYDDTFADPRLDGTWQLVTADNVAVAPYETNYLYFNGSGGGMYYFYDNGSRRKEQIQYYCYHSDNSTSNYQINIRYQFGERSTMNYWLAQGQLFMQWRLTTTGRPVTYVYQRSTKPW